MSAIQQSCLAIVIALGVFMSTLTAGSKKIEVSLSSPNQCSIENRQLQCATVAEYLLNTLKLPFDTEVTVTWTFYKNQHKYANQVVDQLKQVGYHNLWCIGFEEDPFS